MLTVENSRLLAKKKQIAVYNKDIEMIKKIEKITTDFEITLDIINYKIKVKSNEQ